MKMMYGTSIWELSDTSLSSCAPQSSFNEVHGEITARFNRFRRK